MPAAACDFFKELEGNESESSESGSETQSDSETSETGDSEETGANSCVFGVDDYCASQDLLETCDPDTQEFVTFDCSASCGANINVSCLSVGIGRSCWCAQPGNTKTQSCSELEDCLDTCGAGAYEACGEACFAKTDTQTIRLLGSLIACAEESCRVPCDADAPNCAGCLYDARQGLIGNCALERSICDMDSNGDAWP